MKITTFIIAIFLVSIFNTQAQSYDFEATTGTYENLVGSTSLNNDMTWYDEEIYTLPIPFDLDFFDTTTNELYIGNGFFLINQLTEPIISGMSAYSADIIDRGWDTTSEEPTTGSLSNISYLLEGNTGNRILKIEWNNVGYYEDLFDNNDSIDFTNFQIWLYEDSNNIEIHFGPNSITQPNLVFDGQSGSNGLGLVNNLNVDTEEFDEQIVLSGNPTSPTIGSNFDDTFFDGVIPNGTIYRFTKATSGISDSTINSNEVIVFPNPAKNEITINTDLDFDSIAVYSILGNKITENNSSTINVSNLSQGMYLLKVKVNNTILTKTFIKI